MFSLVFSIAFVASMTHASNLYIADKGFLGCKRTAIEEPEIEVIMLHRADSIKFMETSKAFTTPVEIWGRYIFEDIPCLRMYTLWSGVPYSHWYEDVFERIIFNVCDSSIYHFGGNCEQFSIVMKTVLNDNLDDTAVKDLFSLYVNTLSSKQDFHAIKSGSDFEYYYIEEIEHSANFLGVDDIMVKKRWNYDKDIQAIHQIVEKPDISKSDNSKNLKIFTWDNRYGKIEFWRVKITDGTFEVLERLEHLKGVGPGFGAE